MDTPNPDLATQDVRRLRRWLAVAFFVSGTGALMLEVVWNRWLHLLFGGSAVAVTAVLAAYMGGLAVGSLWVAPWVRQRRHGLWAYGVMELLIAAYALVVPWLLDVDGPLSLALAVETDSALGSAVVRFVTGALVLLFPTTLMGATLPCLADVVAALDVPDDRTRDVGSLYSANTLGAVAGTLGATFVAFELLGVAGTNLAAAGLDTLAGVVALSLWNVRGRPGTTFRPAAVKTAVPPVPAPLWAYGVSGAVAMALEVLWTRSLSMVLGSSIHAFSLMLASFLSGLAVGARVGTSGVLTAVEPRKALGGVLAVTALLAFGGTMLVDQLPWLVWTAAKSPDVTPTTMWLTMVLCSALVMVPAAVGFGAVMPLALRAAGAQRGDLGALVGRAYAINTSGAITGSLLAGFVLAPQVGVDHGAQALCVVLLGTAALMLAGVTRLGALGAVVAAALMVLWNGYDVAQWSVGAFRVYLARAAWGDGLPRGNVIYRRDGLATTVTVEEYDGRVSLKVNGKTDASSEGDMPTQVLSGLLPVLLHPNPHRTAIIGFGSGVTADALLSHGGITGLDMVELEEAVVEAGWFFSAVNHQPWTDPRYRGVMDDGRHHLTRPGAPFDIIISEPSNPWITGASNLFTREFWTLARRRLAKGGVFLQWVQLYELSTQRIQALMGTFGSVFPHVLVFAAHPESNDTFLIGSNEPLMLDETVLRQRWNEPGVRWQLERADVRGPLDPLALVLMDRQRLDHFTAGFHPNTDDNLYIELNAPQDLIAFAHKEPELPFMQQLRGARAPLLSRVSRLDARDPREEALVLADVMLRTGMMEDARAYAVQLVGAGSPWEERKDRILEVLEAIIGDAELAVVDEHNPELSDKRYIAAVAAMVEGHEGKALGIFEQFPGLEKESLSHRFLYAFLLHRADFRWRARDAMEVVLQDAAYCQQHPAALLYGARISWLADDNQRAARLGYRFVDLRGAQRDAAVQKTMAAP